MSEPLDLNNVLEVRQILLKCSPNERDTLQWILKCANKTINDPKIKVIPFKIEENIEPELSDHSSDDDMPLLEPAEKYSEQ